MSLSREQRLNKLDEIKDKEIDYSDIPELDDTFWANAVLDSPVSWPNSKSWKL